MHIVLTRDLKGPKAIEHGFIEGAAFDWPRSVVTSVSRQEGDETWFRFSAELERRRNVEAAESEDVESDDLAASRKKANKRRASVTEDLEV